MPGFVSFRPLAGPLLAVTVALQLGGGRPVAAQQKPVGAPAVGFQLLAVAPTTLAVARPAAGAVQPALRAALRLTADDELRPLRTETDELGQTHQRYQQFFKGVKVEHGVVTAHLRGNVLATLSGEVAHPARSLSPQPRLSAATARAIALNAMGGTRYRWQEPAEEALLRRQTGDPHASFFPQGELVFVGDFRQPEARRAPVLAWKFNVYETAPVVRRDLLYVDARSGQLVLRDAVIKHVAATATMATRYLGQRTATTEAFGGGFRLRDLTRSRGVVTLNCETGTSFAAATEFTDNDNNWTAAEYNNAAFDNAALDAHIGAQATQDYWVSQHHRDSFDDRGSVLWSYVHFDDRFENAFWDGTEMVYGDGASRFRPLTAVDVCGHEIGHAVCETTANLVYRDESGAINEGFSDIWGACVEFSVDSTKQTWLVGEDIDQQRPSLRSMSNPNAEGSPDTYQGTNWDPGQEVHTNSGVMNFWFYLLSVGGTGTNDNGTPYAVTGINIHQAARIAYRAEKVYMTPNTNYDAARQTTLQAAVDLYGLGSRQVEAVAQAWRAVGVGGDVPPTVTTLTPTSGPVGTLVTINGQQLGTTFRITFNGTAATALLVPTATQLVVTVPPGATTGPVVVTTTAGSVTAGTFTVTGTGTAPSLLSYNPAAGAPQGAAVVLTGTNLTGATAVRFNGTTAVFTVNSATQISTTVPVTATSGLLTVTTPGGTATAPTPFEVLPAVTAVAPTSGPVNTAITLTGTSLTDALSVRFTGGAYATFTVASATRLNVTVPAGARTGPITVRTPSGAAGSPVFTVTPSLLISDFSPAMGPVQTIVTIQGVGFTGATAVRFNGTAATTMTVVSDQEVWATVPAGATTGPISVTAPLGTVTSTRLFTVQIPGAPTILSFTPPYGTVGTSVTLSGTDFTGATSVKFNGTSAPIVSLTATRLVTTVPVGATTGQITVTTPLGTAASTLNFRVVVAPTNDLCTTTSLPVLTCGSVLTGSTLGASTNGDPTSGQSCGTSIDGAGIFYRFVGTGAAVTVATCGTSTHFDTKLHVFTGTCGTLICVDGNDDTCGQASSVSFVSGSGTSYLIMVSGYNGAEGDFTLTTSCATPPGITTFTPTSGPVGTVVTITGTGLSSTGTVRFNTTATGPITTAATQVTASVPAGATTGPISLVTPAGTVTTTGVFTVTSPAILSFTPPAGPIGTVVTVTGANLTGTTQVRFGGIPASTFQVQNATTLTATVPTGALTGPISLTNPAGTATSALPFTVQRPAPANDNCTATSLPVLTCGGTLAGYTIGATTIGDPNSAQACGTSIDGAGVFYRFVGTGTTVTVQTCSALTDFDTKLHIFTGTCGALVCVTGNDDNSCGVASAVTFLSAAGTPYLIFVSGYGGSAGDFVLSASCVSGSPAPTISSFTPTSGPVGTVVTVTGTNLTGTTAVRFNGGTTTFTVSSATRLTATVPAGATTGPISLTTPGGTATSTARFTVLAAPAITTLSPLAGPVGTVVTVTGQRLTGATAVRFGLLAATGVQVNAAGTQLTCTVPAGARYTPVSVTTAGGTTTSTASFCTRYAATATGAARCGAGTLNLTATGAPAPTATSYAWFTTATGGTPIAGATGPTLTTPSLSATTTYYVAVSLNPAACVGTRVPVTATINAAPVATVTASGPTTFCTGGSVRLTATGGTTYRWSTGATTATITVTTAGTYTVTATGSCSATSAPVVVRVTTAPTAGFAYAAPNVCRSGPNPVPTVTGTTGGVFTATPAGLTLNPATGAVTLASSAPGTYTVTYAVGSGTCAASTTRPLTLTAAPTATFAYPAPDVCAGTATMLAPTLSASATAGVFTAVPAGLTLNPATGAISVETSAPGSYTVTNRVNASGCALVSATALVTVRPVPVTPTLTATPQSAGSVLLTSSASAGNQWYFNGTPLTGATSRTYLASTGAQSGSYTVVVTTAAGSCPSAPSAPLAVTVVTGLAPAAGAGGLTLAPNPARGSVRVNLPAAIVTAPATLTLLDATGRTVRAVPVAAGATELTLDLRGLPAGVYTVQHGARRQRLVVE